MNNTIALSGSNPNKDIKLQTLFGSEYGIVILYQNGDICEKAGRPRSFQINVHCDPDADELLPNDILAYGDCFP